MNINRKFDLSTLIDAGPGKLIPALHRKWTHHATIDSVMERAVGMVKALAYDWVYTEIYYKLNQAVETYVLMNGPLEKGARLYQSDPWHEGMDDVIANVLEDYQADVSASWLGEAVIDTRMNEEGAVDRLSGNFANEVWRQMTWLPNKDEPELSGPKTNAQILSSVGVLRADLEQFVQTRSELPEKEMETLIMNSLETAIPRIKGFVDMLGYDDKALTMILDNALDNDKGLAQGGLQQIGASLDDRDALRSAAMMYGTTELIKMIRAGFTPLTDGGGPQPAPITAQTAQQSVQAAQPAQMPIPEKPSRKNKADGVPQVGQVPPEAFAILKDYTGVKVEKLGEGLGVSRASYENYLKGKARFFAKPEHSQFLLSVIDGHMTALAKAKAMIEGAGSA
jgi:hypothetical protein